MTSISHITKKTREPILTSDSLLGGGYLRLPVSLTGGVVTLRALCLERDEAGNKLKRDKKTREPISDDFHLAYNKKNE